MQTARHGAVCIGCITEIATRLVLSAAARSFACHSVLSGRIGQPTFHPCLPTQFSNTLLPPNLGPPRQRPFLRRPISFSVSSSLIPHSHHPFSIRQPNEPRELHRTANPPPAQISQCTPPYPWLRWLPAPARNSRATISASAPSLRFSILVSSPALP